MAQAVAEFQQLLAGLASQLGVSIATLVTRLDALNQRELLAFITDAYPDLITPYLATAADVTATWYDEQPAKTVNASFTAQPADLVSVEQLTISGRWAMLQADPVTALQGTATRSVFTASRDTVVTNAKREHVRWARHASANACGFCRLLATRGAVYRSQQSAQKAHDHCHCLAVPDRDGRYEPPPYVAQWNEDYTQARQDGAHSIGQIANAMDKSARRRGAAARPPRRVDAKGPTETPQNKGPSGPGGPPNGPAGASSAASGDDDGMRLTTETRQWAQGLSTDQRAAVERWQGIDRFYREVQAALEGTAVTDEAVDVADKLLEVTSHPLVGRYTTWRGVRSSTETFGVGADQLETLVGSTAPLDRFMATSLDRQIAVDQFTKPELAGGAVLFEVSLAPGTRVGWIAPVGSPELAYQQELLVRPGMLQRIVGIDRSGPVPIVKLEVSPP